MQYRLGDSLRVKSHGSTAKLKCPECLNEVEFKVFSNMDIRLIPKCPLINSENIYFLVCPKCASIYTVDKSKGDVFKKGEKLAIGNYDLNKLEEFK